MLQMGKLRGEWADTCPNYTVSKRQGWAYDQGLLANAPPDHLLLLVTFHLSHLLAHLQLGRRPGEKARAIACDSGKGSPGIRDFSTDRSGQKWPQWFLSLGKVLLFLGPRPQLPPPPSHLAYQDPPCQETLSHPLSPNYLFSLNSPHLRRGKEGV